MQYRNLNLDKLQAFAPERKLIDKENIYNAFLGLGDALQKGADAYVLNKIYQLSPEERQRKMAEYRAYKGDFSGFDNIEQTKLRQAEMNALKEQQRADKENENAIVQRDKELSYNALTREKDVLRNKLLNNMRKYNDENSDKTYRDINDKEIQIRFLKEQDTGLLQEFLTNYNETVKLGHESKNVGATIEDVFGLEKSDRAEPTTEESKEEDPKKEDPKKEDIINIDGFAFDRPNDMEEYLKNPRYQSKQGLTKDQKNKIKEYIPEIYNLYNGKVIIDGLSKDEIKKIKDVGFDTITQKEVDKSKKQAEVKKIYNTIAEDLVKGNFGKRMTDESDIAYIKRMYGHWKDSKKFYPEFKDIVNRVDKNLIEQLEEN